MPEATAPRGPTDERMAWLWATVVVTLLYGLLLGSFVPRFETMDDVAMAMWSSGLCLALEPQSHLIFSHELIGWGLQHLYLLWPVVGWYGWFHGTVLLAANVAICRIFWCRARRTGLLAFIAYFAFTQVDAFVLMQFTKTAFYATLAGVFLLAQSGSRSRPERASLVGACLFACLGALIRPESFIFSIVLCLPTLAVVWWRQDGTVTASFRKRGWMLAIFLAGPALLTGSSIVIDRLGEWRRYYDYRITRAQVLDFGERITYNKDTQALFAQINWTDNHLAMLRQASYFDPEIFSAEKYRHLLEAFPVRRQLAGAGAQLRAFADLLRGPWYFEIIVTGIIVWLVVIRRGNFLTGLTAPISAMALLVSILLLIKWPPHRVILPILGGTFALLLWQGSHDASFPTRWRGWLSFACGAGIMLFAVRLLPDFLQADRKFRRESAAALQELAELRSDRTQLYFAWENNFPYELTFLPYDHHPALFRHHLQIGSWGIHNPIFAATLQHFGLSRPYQDLVGHLRFFLIARTDRVETYRRFMRESYQQEVVVEPIKRGQNLLVWRVREQKK